MRNHLIGEAARVAPDSRGVERDGPPWKRLSFAGAPAAGVATVPIAVPLSVVENLCRGSVVRAGWSRRNDDTQAPAAAARSRMWSDADAPKYGRFGVPTPHAPT